MSTTTTSGERQPFTLDDVLQAANEVVNEKGHDYVYDPSKNPDGGCVYAVHGTPSCLVGHVIYRLDPAIFAGLAKWERQEGSEAASHLRKRGWLPGDFWTDEAEFAMQRGQDSQDAGEPWGYAIVAAENLGGDAD